MLLRYSVYTGPGVIRVMISRRVRWAGHVVLMGDMNVYKIPKEGTT
jgi:hypothetical protein